MGKLDGQQCEYNDTSYWENRKVKDANARDEVVEVKCLTYDQYYVRFPEKKPKFPIIEMHMQLNKSLQ
jgi:hypothetical protein